jgi:CO dehydrogenase/acetyl-CoA synthase delta subunit
MKGNDNVATELEEETCSCSSGKPAPCCGPPETEGPPDLEDIGVVTSTIETSDRLVHLLARLGVRRSEWRVRPGLYRLGEAGPDSPVFVSANYRLSFDALRGALEGIDAYILVLDTKGINVWCAAGKGTFGTDELVSRIDMTGLAGVVKHRTVIAPQLSATGVAAHEVRERSGFKVRFGPVRAEDIPEFIETGKATEEMRRVRFGLKDRAVLIPVDTVVAFPFAAGAAALSYIAGDSIAAAGIISASAAGLVGFPVLLPWLPGEEFSIKGFFLGGLVGLSAAAVALAKNDDKGLPSRVLKAASYALALPPITAFMALNFTGSSTYASPSGVRREINTYIPVMAAISAVGLIMNISQRLMRRKG